jgi:hypothetical protein
MRTRRNANSLVPSARLGPPAALAAAGSWWRVSHSGRGTPIPPPLTLTAAEAWAYFTIAALLDTVIGLRSFPGVLHGDLLNPDSYMRLDRLQDILARHAPLHVVLRDASGAGAVLHWSHLLDSLLLLLALPLRPFLSQPASLHVAAVLVGPLGVGLLGTATAWAMAPFADRGWRLMAPVLAGLAFPIVAYGLPGVAHHHVLLAVATVVMAGAAGRAATGDRAAGRRLGVWAGAAIWLSPESWPLVLMAFGGCGLSWMLSAKRPGVRQSGDLAVGEALTAAGSLFLLMVACTLTVDPPLAGFGSVELDRLSVVYLVLAAVTCAIGWTLWGLDRTRFAASHRVGVAAVVATAGLGLWFALFPAVLLGPSGLVDAEAERIFTSGIEEMRPVASLAQAVGFLFDGAVATLLLIWFAVSRRSFLWAYGALCVGVMLVLGQRYVRFSTYPAAAAAATLPVILTECTRLLAMRPQIVQAAARVGAIALMMLSYPSYLALGDDWAASRQPVAAPDCRVGTLGPMLAPYAGQVVLTDVNDVPELLYRTGILTVGSLYLRNVAAFMRLRAAWRSEPSDTVPEAVRTTRATLVLACPRAGPHAGRSALVADLPPNTLLDRLNRGTVPPWLKEVAKDPASGHVLYQIVP